MLNEPESAIQRRQRLGRVHSILKHARANSSALRLASDLTPAGVEYMRDFLSVRPQMPTIELVDRLERESQHERAFAADAPNTGAVTSFGPAQQSPEGEQRCPALERCWEHAASYVDGSTQVVPSFGTLDDHAFEQLERVHMKALIQPIREALDTAASMGEPAEQRARFEVVVVACRLETAEQPRSRLRRYMSHVAASLALSSLLWLGSPAVVNHTNDAALAVGSGHGFAGETLRAGSGHGFAGETLRAGSGHG